MAEEDAAAHARGEDVEMLDVSGAFSDSESAAASDRQFGIWSSRAQREFAKCQARGALPVGVTLERVHMDASRGACAGDFRCFVPFQDGSDALQLIPLTMLRVALPFDAAANARGAAQFPFRAPEVTVLRGAELLPPEMLAKRAAGYEGGDEPPRRLLLPSLEHWSPSNTLVMILHDFVATVQKHDPPVVAKQVRDGGTAGTAPPARMRLRKRDIVGKIYACQEVDPIASRLVPTPMLLQTGSIVLLLPPGRDAIDNDPFVYVSSLIPLKEVARITPQRGKSVTLFFRDRKLSCRTFLTRDTDAIVAGIRHMIAATGVKRGRDDDSNPLTQLMGFLSPEHSEKAKEMSSKFMGKLSKYANSVSRFLRGDDEEELARQRDHELFTSALNETNSLKTAFFRTPSKQRMTEITRRYQSIAEEFAQRRNAEGYVEHAIEELQEFIEHPVAGRILSETSAVEQFNRGIRVGPA